MKPQPRLVVALVACAGVGTTLLVQNLTPPGVLTLSKSGATVTSSWLPGWLYQRRTVDYAAITAEAFQQPFCA